MNAKLKKMKALNVKLKRNDGFERLNVNDGFKRLNMDDGSECQECSSESRTVSDGYECQECSFERRKGGNECLIMIE